MSKSRDKPTPKLIELLEKDPGQTVKQLGCSEREPLGRNNAAVAIIFRNLDHNPEVLLVKRISSSSDPWSGQIAFPGGRYRPLDGDLKETVLRELEEETGVGGDAVELLGTLPPVSPANVPTLKVTPFVGLLIKDVELRKGSEIEKVFWIALYDLKRRVESVYAKSVGRVRDYLCYVFDGEVVWGMTAVLLRKIMLLIGL